ncbi:magnesium and cobalt transport protein CorA [Lottiidibacillus patelloidae]|uniref:Magnesium transport protein CorA n=1 Tax=Lottiidibacillus patelloidae TaxID=2670334 RepID=A0A263BXE8_9BACI|nr:magnesium/cobalt transporter CorA [Lottiidibacillus patelloidae]OZM58340.1 magnesium and cobalt transport protein CorA [Lottiidibacillus patelloidae]
MKFIRKRDKKQSLPPGTLTYVGEEQQRKDAVITVINYGKNTYEEKTIETIEESYSAITSDRQTWINITGLTDIKTIEKIGKELEIHPLLLEDIVNSEHRPKLEVNENHMLAIVKRLYYSEEEEELQNEQISIILSKNVVITFQEFAGDDFETIRKQIRHSVGGIRACGTDFLFYRLLDSVVDRYIIEVEELEDRLEELEEKIIDNPEQSLLHAIYQKKHDVVGCKKIVTPMKEVISQIQKSDFPYLTEQTKFFIKDIQDHMIDVTEKAETTRSMITGLIELYYSSVSYKMNEIMKVLTIVSTTFIPLTFIAGIYGMNFHRMPELHSKWGYPAVMGGMVLIAIGMFIYFRKKKWF